MDAPKETRSERIEQAGDKLLRDMDAMINEVVFPDALPDQTVSDDVATMALPTDTCRLCHEIGAAFCWFLNIFVQKDHCDVTLHNGPMPWTVYFWAAVWFCLFPIALLIVAGRFVWAGLFPRG
jgi:hypothetical protein